MEGAESKNLLQGRFALWHHVIQQILDQSRTRIGFLSSDLSPAAAASWDLPLGRLKNTRRMQSSCSAFPRDLLIFFPELLALVVLSRREMELVFG